MSATRTIDLILPTGMLADRPDAALVPAGSLFPAIDDQVIYRNNDTGTEWEPWLEVGDFSAYVNAEEVRDIVAALLKAGTGITLTNNDGTDELTIGATTDPEVVRDAIAAALVAGTGVTITSDDAGNTITISVSASVEAEVVRDLIGATLVAGDNVTITVNDVGNTVTIDATGGGGGGDGIFLGQWVAVSYDEDQYVVYGGTLWRSTVDGNTDTPADDSDWEAATYDPVPPLVEAEMPSLVAVSASASYGPYVAANAFDNVNDYSSRWLSESGLPAWLRGDFLYPTTVDHYVLSNLAEESARNPRSWAFQGSNDGAAWTTIDSRVDANWAPLATEKIFMLSSPATWKMYRVLFSASVSDGSYVHVRSLSFRKYAGGKTLDTLDDVVALAPGDGYVLIYDLASQTWVAQPPPWTT